MGAGKTTKAAALSHAENTILISEDEWLAALYPGLIKIASDYVHYSSLLKPPVKALAQSLLESGVDVVLDFPGNTAAQRQWLRTVSDEVGAAHVLYVLTTPDDICRERVAARAKAMPERCETDTAAMFDTMARYFTSPEDEEGLTVVTIPHHD